MTTSSRTHSLSKRLLASVACAGFAALLASSVWAKATSAPAPSSDSMSQEQESDLRLELDKVNLAAESGNLDKAYELLDKLKAKYPGNPDVLALETDLNSWSLERRSAVLSNTCGPISLDSNSTDLLQHDRTLTKGGFACAGYNRRETNQSLEQIENLTGQVAVPFPGTAVTFDLENDHVNSREPFVRLNGTEQSFYGSRQQGTVMVEKAFSNHDAASVLVYGNDSNAGAGAQFVHPDHWGGTSVLAHFAQPDWDYVEGIVEDATRDGVHVERKQVFNQNLQALLNLGYEHYSIDGLPDAADAPGWSFGLDYTRPVKLSDLNITDDETWMNDEITFGAHYGVQAEYFTFVDHRFDRQNNFFHPLPAASYEVHEFTVSAGKTILPDLDAEVQGGYGVNRLTGGNGPIYAGALTYTPIQHLGVDIHASRTLLGGQNNGGKEDIAGASVKWVW